MLETKTGSYGDGADASDSDGAYIDRTLQRIHFDADQILRYAGVGQPTAPSLLCHNLSTLATFTAKNKPKPPIRHGYAHALLSDCPILLMSLEIHDSTHPVCPLRSGRRLYLYAPNCRHRRQRISKGCLRLVRWGMPLGWS